MGKSNFNAPSGIDHKAFFSYLSQGRLADPRVNPNGHHDGRWSGQNATGFIDGRLPRGVPVVNAGKKNND